MIEYEFLKELNILYAEDDDEVRKVIQSALKKIFGKLYVAKDGREALNIFNQETSKKVKIHAIISDINMPDVDGLRLLNVIRENNPSLPFIITSAYSESEYLLKAINLNVNNYLLKPIDINNLIKKVFDACYSMNQKFLIKKQKKELERYLRAIDNVAIISKTDFKGQITFVNDIFCDIAQYTKEELIGNHHNMVRHPDMPSNTFKELWQTIKSGHSWNGKVKNRAKDGSAYYVNASIIPLYDNKNENIIEYIGIRFLTTDDELEKREFKKKVIQNIQETKKKHISDANQIKLLENKLKTYAHADLINEALQNERKKSSRLTLQINQYENDIKNQQNKHNKFIENSNTKINKLTKTLLEYKDKNSQVTTKVSQLKEEIDDKESSIKVLKKRIGEQSKVITDLRDVIKHLEEEIDKLKR